MAWNDEPPRFLAPDIDRLEVKYQDRDAWFVHYRIKDAHDLAQAVAHCDAEPDEARIVRCLDGCQEVIYPPAEPLKDEPPF